MNVAVAKLIGLPSLVNSAVPTARRFPIRTGVTAMSIQSPGRPAPRKWISIAVVTNRASPPVSAATE